MTCASKALTSWTMIGRWKRELKSSTFKVSMIQASDMMNLVPSERPMQGVEEDSCSSSHFSLSVS
jgi:hypothetical protein